MTTDLDPRVNALDHERKRAEEALRPVLTERGWTFHAPQPARARTRLSLRSAPEFAAPQVTEALPGEALEVLWASDDGHWSRVRTRHDGYLGWAHRSGLVPGRLGSGARVTGEEPSLPLTVTVLRAHAFAAPRVSAHIVAELCLGATLEEAPWPAGAEAGEDVTRRWRPVRLPGGEVAWAARVAFDLRSDADPAALALRFLGAPYVWGGRSAWGLDCSGLTQLVCGAFGVWLPRDADQQQEALPAVEQPERGDLAFFDGHVGLMLDDRQMVHANARHMAVTVDTLGEGEYGAWLREGLLGFGRPGVGGGVA